MRAVIFHNPKCSTSRHVLSRLQEAGCDAHVVEYLKEGWTRPLLMSLLAAAGLKAGDILRRRGTPADELGLSDATPEDALIDAMIAHPVLVERPIVCSERGTLLCRPKDLVERLLDA